MEEVGDGREVEGDTSMESVPENDAKEEGAMDVDGDGDKAVELEKSGESTVAG